MKKLLVFFFYSYIWFIGTILNEGPAYSQVGRYEAVEPSLPTLRPLLSLDGCLPLFPPRVFCHATCPFNAHENDACTCGPIFKNAGGICGAVYSNNAIPCCIEAKN